MNQKPAPTEGQSSEQTASLATSDDAACSVSSETPESDRLIQKQGVTHAELYRALCVMERKRNGAQVERDKAQRIAIKSRGIIVTLEKNVTTSAVKLVEFWESKGGGNGVMARALEDALIREVSAYKKTPAHIGYKAYVHSSQNAISEP